MMLLSRAHLSISAVTTLLLSLIIIATTSPDSSSDEQRKALGEHKFQELQEKTVSSSCWKEAVARLNTTCKKIIDVEQSRLAVAFANCHLAKSGRQVYPCSDTMTIRECTGDMDTVAFQTYTEFFTHTGHICYFLQNEIWQDRTDRTISKLSEASEEAVKKLEESLEYHREMEVKQNQALDNQAAIIDQDRRIASSLDDTRRSMDRHFDDVNEMARKQKLLLADMFGTLQDSIESVRYLMSLFLIEFVGYETFAVFVVASLVILFLPRFGYSRFKLYLLLFGELVVEVVFRRLFGYFVLGGGAGSRPPPEAMESLHGYLWYCRYIAFIAGIILYMWEWLSYRDHTLILTELHQNTDLIMARLGIESPFNQKRASCPVAMQVVQPDMQGGPPPPDRRSWPMSARGGSKEKEVPTDVQPSELTSRDIPTEVTDGCAPRQMVDGCGFSKRRVVQQVYAPAPIARGGGSTTSPYLFEPIPGLAPPIGHPRSPYTSDRISQYIAGLPEHFEPPGEQSFASTAANPADSDNDQSNDQSNDTLTVFESESPYTRSPLKRSPVSVKNKNKNAARVGGSSRRVLNNWLGNVSPGNQEWAESEKEVAEEKAMKSDKLNTSKSTQEGGHFRHSESLVTPTVTTPTAQRRRTLQAPSPADTPRRYNLRPRTPRRTPMTNK